MACQAPQRLLANATIDWQTSWAGEPLRASVDTESDSHGPRAPAMLSEAQAPSLSSYVHIYLGCLPSFGIRSAFSEFKGSFTSASGYSPIRKLGVYMGHVRTHCYPTCGIDPTFSKVVFSDLPIRLCDIVSLCAYKILQIVEVTAADSTFAITFL